jgi:C-terminal domain of alpha-glycerophosphate oxidase
MTMKSRAVPPATAGIVGPLWCVDQHSKRHRPCRCLAPMRVVVTALGRSDDYHPVFGPPPLVSSAPACVLPRAVSLQHALRAAAFVPRCSMCCAVLCTCRCVPCPRCRAFPDAYGDRAPEITRIAEERKLGRRLVRGHPELEAEVVYCAKNELCETAEDFIARRTRLAFVDVMACEQALPKASGVRATGHAWPRRQAA